MSSSITKSFSERISGGNTEGISAGIDNVGGTIFKNVSDVDDRVTSLRTFVHEFIESFLNGSDIFGRNGSTNNSAYELAFCFSRL